MSDGASTHVIINQVHRKELGQPYGPCLKRNDEHSDLLDDLQVNPSASLKMLKKINEIFIFRVTMIRNEFNTTLLMIKCACTSAGWMQL